MAQTKRTISDDIHALGDLLGQTLKTHEGEATYELVEQIRTLAKSARTSEPDAHTLRQLIRELPDEATPQLARAFGQFLHLANIAESYDNERQLRQQREPMMALLPKLLEQNQSAQAITEALCDQQIELVLTAHPTEVKRRTLIQKYGYIAGLLEQRDRLEMSDAEVAHWQNKLKTVVSSIWLTDEIRRVRPTPVEEAKWGFAVIEDTLWQAIPQYLRRLDDAMQTHLGKALPLDCAPITIGAWMGGDRDGNPNVTSEVTHEVLLLAQWMAMDLYTREVNRMVQRLSMHACNDALRDIVGETSEPYRVYLRILRDRLSATRAWLQSQLAGHDVEPEMPLILNREDLLQPLMLCYQSLIDCGAEDIANASMVDLIRRVHVFGTTLVRLDVRQEADRHSEVMATVTDYLGLGDYQAWSEQEKCAFLQTELTSKRPLLPPELPANDNVQEVLATCRVIAQHNAEAMGAYVISMASTASDVLAVQLLQKMVGVAHPMRVVPLFETLDDLNQASTVMRALYDMPVYKDTLQGRQEVMIGYSDSGKDAGKLAASWAQYEAQEQLLAVSQKAGVQLTLFHGRGGSVGRGGGPVHSTLLSQPPGSVQGRMRVTEQGEVIQQKYGLLHWAQHNLMLYSVAALEATLLPPPEPKPTWRAVMAEMSAVSVEAYRHVVREKAEFVPYFRQVTPEQELGRLLIGSRPAKRKAQGGIESLRAIPWVFAWTQTRLMLPAWLGIGEALDAVLPTHKDTLCDMLKHWPFFYALMDMLDMVLTKADSQIAAYYDDCLAEPDMKAFGEDLRTRLQHTKDMAHRIAADQALREERQALRQSLTVRNTYADPLNLLQAEVMRRLRSGQVADERAVEDALMLCIAGISAAMKNTG